MSIIYDALKKTQQEREGDTVEMIRTRRTLRASAATTPVVTAKAFPHLKTSLVICAIVLTIATILYSKFTSKAPAKQDVALASPRTQIQPVPTTPIVAAQTPAVTAPTNTSVSTSTSTKAQVDSLVSKLNLSGVFLSNHEKIAIINNKTFRVGDEIDNMLIVEIEENKVRLQHENGIIEITGRG